MKPTLHETDVTGALLSHHRRPAQVRVRVARGHRRRVEQARATLGDEMSENFIRNKKLEWDEYKTQVSEFEIKRYLPIL